METTAGTATTAVLKKIFSNGTMVWSGNWLICNWIIKDFWCRQTDVVKKNMNRGNPKPPALHEHFENLDAKGKTLAKAAVKESNEQIN